jgi:hypothetical protein
MPPANEIVETHEIEIEDGVVCVGSDCHYRPDEPASTAHDAFVETVSRFAADGTLQVVILNGDVADFPSVSRHPRIGWEQQPAVADEIAIVQQRMVEIAEIAGLDTALCMTIGNHDARLDTFLSQNAAACECVRASRFATISIRFGQWRGRLRSTAQVQTVCSPSIGIARVLVHRGPM